MGWHSLVVTKERSMLRMVEKSLPQRLVAELNRMEEDLGGPVTVHITLQDTPNYIEVAVRVREPGEFDVIQPKQVAQELPVNVTPGPIYPDTPPGGYPR